MSRRNPDPTAAIEVYKHNEPTKFPSSILISFVEAMALVDQGLAKRIHRKKIVLHKPERAEPRHQFAPGSQIERISIDVAVKKTQGGLCNGN